MTANTNQANQLPQFTLRNQKTAMLVVHGIGEQNPYETLDSFARGVLSFLREKLGDEHVKLDSVKIALKDWTQVGMRLKVKSGLDYKTEGQVDIFEYYWAPDTEGKLSWKDTLNWLIRTDLTPLRYFADNLQQMMNVPQARFHSALWHCVKLYAREIMRVLFLYVPLAVGLLWLLSWLSQPSSIWKSLKPIVTALQPYSEWPKPVVLACYASGLLMTLFMLQSFIAFLNRSFPTMRGWARGVWLALTQPGFKMDRMKWAKGVRSALDEPSSTTIQGWAEGLWFVLALLSTVAFFAVGHFLPILWPWFAVDLQPLRETILINKKEIVFAVLALSAAAALRYVLTAYVADVAVYVSADAKSKNYVARSAILKGSSAALTRILADDQYDRVILAGHSLGSVIAYDTINELLAQADGELGPTSDRPTTVLCLSQLQKLRGLLTFGSPLDKIYYFFREHVKEDQAIRAQILSMLHFFRKVRSRRNYKPYDFTYTSCQLDELVWVNAYAFMDPVGARLKFYKLEPEDQKSFWYWIPGLAHLSYWGDPNFYSYFGEKLL